MLVGRRQNYGDGLFANKVCGYDISCRLQRRRMKHEDRGQERRCGLSQILTANKHVEGEGDVGSLFI